MTSFLSLTNKKKKIANQENVQEPDESSFSQFEDTNVTGIRQRVKTNNQPNKGSITAKEEPLNLLKINTIASKGLCCGAFF